MPSSTCWTFRSLTQHAFEFCLHINLWFIIFNFSRYKHSFESFVTLCLNRYFNTKEYFISKSCEHYEEKLQNNLNFGKIVIDHAIVLSNNSASFQCLSEVWTWNYSCMCSATSWSDMQLSALMIMVRLLTITIYTFVMIFEFINVIHMWPCLITKGADATITLSRNNVLKLKSSFQPPAQLKTPKVMQFINTMWRSIGCC
jgi:hypothetical protein